MNVNFIIIKMHEFNIMLMLLLFAVSVQLAFSEKRADDFNLLTLYEGEVELSAGGERSARNVSRWARRRWAAEQVRLLADYRVRLADLKTITLRQNNRQGDDCTKDVSSRVEEEKKIYLESEDPCTEAANSGVVRSAYRLQHAIREVKRWRQGLVFMSRACHDDHPNNYVAAVQCMYRRVEPEQYDKAITRLTTALEQVQNEFLTEIGEASFQLESCIAESFSTFESALAAIVENVTLCREERRAAPGNLRKQNGDRNGSARDQRGKIFRLKCLDAHKGKFH